MGSKPWQNLSALVLAGAALVGCNNTPQKTDNSYGATNGYPPPKTAQTAQQPPAPNFPVQGAQQGNSGFGIGQQPVSPVGIPTTANSPNMPTYGNIGGGSVAPPANPNLLNPNGPIPAGPSPYTAPAPAAGPGSTSNSLGSFTPAPTTRTTVPPGGFSGDPSAIPPPPPGFPR